MSTIPSQRHLFAIPDDVAYFNCAYNSPLLVEAQRRLEAGVRSKTRPWERTPDDFFASAELVRTLAAAALGGDAEGYAIVPAASYGMSTAARAIEPRLRPGDRILIVAGEFPSHVLPWKRAALETGAIVETIPEPEDGDWTRAILDRIVDGVKVVAVSTCHWTNGALIDLRPIGLASRRIGATLAVDATQTLGAMPFPFEEADPDFLVAAGYKWLLSPYGFGLLYVAERWRDARPLEESWLARRGTEDFATLVDCSAEYLPGARRFDVGEKCTATLLPGAIAALEQIGAWGVPAIAASLDAVNSEIAVHLEALGFGLPARSQRCPHMFGAKLPEGYDGDLTGGLKREGIHISRRGAAVRFAPHLHVNAHDVERLQGALSRLLG